MLNSKMTSSHVPAYVSIYNSLYLDIINGVYAPGDYLPGETVLAEKYNVSRNTLRQALAVLNEDGLITKSRGTLYECRQAGIEHQTGSRQRDRSGIPAGPGGIAAAAD